MKQFSVYHSKVGRFGEREVIGFPMVHEKVAIVRCHAMEETFQLTNSICTPWFEGPQVTLVGAAVNRGGARSTSVGDVIVDDSNGDAYGVMGIGFEYLGRWSDLAEGVAL